MPRAAHLEDVDRPRHLTPDLDVLQHQNRVGNRRNMRVSDGIRPHKLIGRIGEEARNLFLLREAGDANNKLSESVIADSARQS